MSSTDLGAAETESHLLVKLSPAPSDAGRARREVRRFCEDGRHDALAEDAVLLTSELVTNACRHAHEAITLVALRDAGSVVVSITNDGAVTEALHAMPEDLDADHGRGLMLVASIAGDWGTRSDPSCTSIWFRLP